MFAGDDLRNWSVVDSGTSLLPKKVAVSCYFPRKSVCDRHLFRDSYNFMDVSQFNWPSIEDSDTLSETSLQVLSLRSSYRIPIYIVQLAFPIIDSIYLVTITESFTLKAQKFEII